MRTVERMVHELRNSEGARDNLRCFHVSEPIERAMREELAQVRGAFDGETVCLDGRYVFFEGGDVPEGVRLLDGRGLWEHANGAETGKQIT